MFYLIQSNIHSDPDHHKIFGILDELGLEYEPIHLPLHSEELHIQTQRKDIFVYGSVKLARLAQKLEGCYPNSFYGGNHRLEIHAPFYREELLNYQHTVAEFAQALQWQDRELKFIKPYRDAKAFTGAIFSRQEWEDFVYEALQRAPNGVLQPQTLIQTSAPQILIKEARIWVVGGKVIGGVYYKYHKHSVFEADVAPEGLAYAQQMCDLYQVAPAFVMDIALTYEGWRMVEINCINSAGLYHFNPRILFRALEAFFN